jgi:predicted O-methyltransferase YrrM
MPIETDKIIQQRFAFEGRNRNLPWYPRRGTRVDLAKLFCELGMFNGVEVGTRDGTFSKILCENNPSLALYCVDPWTAYSTRTQEVMDKFYEQAKSNLANFRCNLIREPSLEAVKEFPDNQLDFVYIDGNHIFDHAIRDIIEWSHVVRDGGIIAVHDYDPFCGSDVIKAVDAYTQAHDIRPWYVTRELPTTAFWVKKSESQKGGH